MGSLLQKLKEYFDNTPLDQIKKNWESTAVFDQIDSPSVESYLADSKHWIDIGKLQLKTSSESFINNFKSPNFDSDFFYFRIQ